MARIIKCGECGHVARGETDEQLVEECERHIRADHPDLVGRISRDDLLEMAEEE